MKSILFKTLAAAALFSFIFLYSCEKEAVAPVVNNIHDTTNICDTLTKAEILTLRDWQIDELYRNTGGVTTHYLRGGVNTTGTTYNNMRFHFNADGTGSYTDENSTVHTVNWSFGGDQTNMTLSVGPPSPITYQWHMIQIKNNYMHNTSPINNTLISTRMIQIP